MASFWKPWTWWSPGQSHSDNFIRNGPAGWTEGAKRFGLPVTLDTAIRLSAVLCAVRVIAEGVAQMPLKVMIEEEKDGKVYRRVAAHDPAHKLLHRRPNAWMTSFGWREVMTIHAALTGNAYSIIARVRDRVDELIPVHPDNMQVKLENGRLSYRATVEGRQIDLDKRDVFHLQGPSMDGVLGMPIVSLARDVLGLTSALEQQQIDLQTGGGRPSGVLSTDQQLDPEAIEDLRAEWKRKFGPNGEGGVAILDKKWTWNAMALTGVEQQFIENRRFMIEEVGRAFRVLPLMIMQSDKTATFASAEQFFQAHDIHTLHPWTQRWEQTIDRDLLTDERTYSNFVMQGLLRAAAADRAEYYARALGAPGSRGWMTQNEVRALEELDPHPDGDELNIAAPEPQKPTEGGGPNAGLPFDLEPGDEDKAYRRSQPRGPDGKWLPMGERLTAVMAEAGKPGLHIMSIGRVRHRSTIEGVTGKNVSGFRFMVSNESVKHARDNHFGAAERNPANIAMIDDDLLNAPAVVRSFDAAGVTKGKLARRGQTRFQLSGRAGGRHYGMIFQVDSRRRWLTLVTMWRFKN